MRLTLLGIPTTVATCVGLVASTGSPVAADTFSRGSARGLGYTQIVVDPAVYQLIASAGITPSPVAPALAFPFRGASVVPRLGRRHGDRHLSGLAH